MSQTEKETGAMQRQKHDTVERRSMERSTEEDNTTKQKQGRKTV